MRRMLANMNLARWIMLISVVLSLALAGTGYTLHQRRVELEDALARSVPRTTQEIQNLSLRYSSLMSELEGEGFEGESGQQTYFRDLAALELVAVGSVDIDTLPTATLPNGIEDLKFSIRPADPERRFGRTKIANYMYKIEEQSRRVRVTAIRLDPAGRKQPWEYGDDRWKWDIEVTSRQKIEP